MEEKRKIEQTPVYDEFGRVEYYKIQNYKRHKNFLTENEKKMLYTIMSAVKKYNDKVGKPEAVVFSQVALNRIVDFNNLRISEQLQKEIRDKSIDFLIYNVSNDEIFSCIELNGREHEENEERKKRDNLITKIFEDIKVKLYFEKNANFYDEKEIYKKIFIEKMNNEQ